MGASDFALGDGPFGFDPVAAPSAAEATHKPAAAILFNITTKRFVMLSDGRYESAHPVDQMVAIALGLAEGDFASAPTVGHTLGEVRSIAAPSFPAESRDRIMQALRVPIARKDIRIHSITSNVIDGAQSPRGRTEFVVAYFNLRSLTPDRVVTVTGAL